MLKYILINSAFLFFAFSFLFHLYKWYIVIERNWKVCAHSFHIYREIQHVYVCLSLYLFLSHILLFVLHLWTLKWMDEWVCKFFFSFFRVLYFIFILLFLLFTFKLNLYTIQVYILHAYHFWKYYFFVFT